MRIEFEISDESFKEAVVKEIASQIINTESNPRIINFWGHQDVRQELRERAIKLLKADKKLEKEIIQEVREGMKDKKLIKKVAQEMIEEKMRDYDD